MIRVLCSETELAEYGERVAVGERLQRRARRVEGASFGTALDSVAWRFDQHAEVAAPGTATVTGTVRAISAVYVEMTRLGDCTWAAARGTAHLEVLSSTADTRRPDEQIALRSARVREGDEALSGWLITLEDEALEQD